MMVRHEGVTSSCECPVHIAINMMIWILKIEEVEGIALEWFRQVSLI